MKFNDDSILKFKTPLTIRTADLFNPYFRYSESLFLIPYDLLLQSSSRHWRVWNIRAISDQHRDNVIMILPFGWRGKLAYESKEKQTLKFFT